MCISGNLTFCFSAGYVHTAADILIGSTQPLLAPLTSHMFPRLQLELQQGVRGPIRLAPPDTQPPC